MTPTDVARFESWFAIAESAEVGRGELATLPLFSEDLVLWRSTAGVISALAPRCQHFGAHLGGGAVCGETLQCAFHGWRYAVDGSVRNDESDPGCVRTFSYPCVESAGLVWVFNGTRPTFPVPTPFGVNDSDFFSFSTTLGLIPQPCYVQVANALDLDHLVHVHATPPFRPKMEGLRFNEIDIEFGYQLAADGTALSAHIVGPNTYCTRIMPGRPGEPIVIGLVTNTPVERAMSKVHVSYWVRRDIPGAEPAARSIFMSALSDARTTLAEDQPIFSRLRLRPLNPGPLDENVVTFLRWVDRYPTNAESIPFG